ncbi:phage tail protein [Streptomyces cucumeris]|uniref:phage tail protein n=1 Tax=Streptomyces cucumeris TaxID=2962890 RepID=UPI003D761498
MTVHLGIDTDQLQAGIAKAKKALAGLGKAVGGLGAGVPAAAAGIAAVGGMAAAFATAGMAAKAFQLAAQPQLQQVAEVADLAAEAEKAAAEGAADAAEKQQAYTDALNRLPPATRATAKEFVGLKGDFKKWSDSMSSTTMPIFTQGLKILRGLLPALTPLVKAAAGAIKGFLDDIQKGVDNGSVADFAKDLAKTAGKNLGAFLRSMKNVVVGFAGIISAFAGVSDNASGGIEEMTAKFASFGQGLKGSEGFAQFIDLARQGAHLFATLGTAAIQLLIALSPLIGITSQLALWLAGIINAAPPGVLKIIAVAWAAIAIGVKAYGLYTTIAAAATRGWAIAQNILNMAFWTSPITWIIVGIVALIAIIVLIATKTTWFQDLWRTVWGAIKSFCSAAVSGILAAVGWLADVPGKIAAWFGAAKDWAVQKFTALLSWLKGFPGRAIGAIASLGGMLWSAASSAGGRLVSAIKSKGSSAINWLRGLPGRAKSAVGNLGRVLWNAGVSLLKGFIGGIKSMFGAVKSKLGGLTSSLTSWKGPENLDKRILTPAGRYVIQGFQRGIAAQTPALRDQLRGVTGDLPGMAMDINPRGVAKAAAGREQQRVLLDVTGGSDDLIRVVRGWLKTNGHSGNVQAGLGSR